MNFSEKVGLQDLPTPEKQSKFCIRQLLRKFSEYVSLRRGRIYPRKGFFQKGMRLFPRNTPERSDPAGGSVKPCQRHEKTGKSHDQSKPFCNGRLLGQWNGRPIFSRLRRGPFPVSRFWFSQTRGLKFNKATVVEKRPPV